MSERTETRYENDERSNNSKKPNPTSFNLLGLDATGTKFYVPRDDLEKKLLEIARKRLGDVKEANTLIYTFDMSQKKKDDDSDNSDKKSDDFFEYDKDSKQTQHKKIKSPVIAISFEEDNPNFTTQSDIFGNVEKRSPELKKFIADFCADDKEIESIDFGRFSDYNKDKKFDKVVKKLSIRDSHRRIYTVFTSVMKVMSYFFDRRGIGYEAQFGNRPRNCDIIIDIDYDTNHRIRGFFVTKQFETYFSDSEMIKRTVFNTSESTADDNVFRNSKYDGDRDRDYRNRDRNNYNNNRNNYNKDNRNRNNDNRKPKSF